MQCYVPSSYRLVSYIISYDFTQGTQHKLSDSGFSPPHADQLINKDRSIYVPVLGSDCIDDFTGIIKGEHLTFIVIIINIIIIISINVTI